MTFPTIRSRGLVSWHPPGSKIHGRTAWLLALRHLLPLALMAGAFAVVDAQQGSAPAGSQRGPGELKVPGFGPVEGTRPIPGFGLGSDAWAVPVTQADLATADERLQRYDTNRDGYLDRNELRSAQWSSDPFQYDTDGDGRLNRMELARRYAERRTGQTGQPPPYGSGGPSQDQLRRDQERRDQERREQERRDQERRSGTQSSSSYRPTRESWHLAQTLMARHDTNRDGSLDAGERRAMGMDSAAADMNRDRRVDTAELATWLTQQEAERGMLGKRELPGWFLQLDADGDGQVAMSEFVADGEWTDEKFEQFAAYDTNGDGIIVAEECLQAMNRMNKEHADLHFQIIPSRGIVRARIDVEESLTIADLDVQLSITHTHNDHLDVFLFGPEGQRVELFTGVGGSDDHFDNTILDEEGPTPIVRGRAPFAGRYHTEARSKGQPGLKQFYGQSMAGTWMLMIEAKSDRPGALHGWSLIFQPVEDTQAPPGSDDFD